MLRITVGHDQDSLTLKLEGRLAGVWVKELKQCWELLPPSSRRPVVCFDLSGLTFVDAAGKAFLAARHTEGAQFVAAKIAQLTASDTIGGQVLDAGKALATYSHVFGVIGLWGLGAGAVMLVLSPWLKKLAHGAHD